MVCGMRGVCVRDRAPADQTPQWTTPSSLASRNGHASYWTGTAKLYLARACFFWFGGWRCAGEAPGREQRLGGWELGVGSWELASLSALPVRGVRSNPGGRAGALRRALRQPSFDVQPSRRRPARPSLQTSLLPPLHTPTGTWGLTRQ